MLFKMSNNMLSNLGYYAFTVILNIWFVPYLIRNLGVEAYGLVPLVSTVVSYFSVVTLVLNSSVGRYLTIALEQNNITEASSIFNTSFFGGVALLVPLSIPMCILAVYPSLFLQIPPGMEYESSLLFMAVVFSFCVSIAMAPFELATYCRNRFDVRNIINLMSSLVRVGLVVTCFSFGNRDVWCVGLGIAVAALVQAAGSLVAWRLLLPGVCVSLRAFSWDSCKKLLGSGWWIAVSHIGTILFLSIDMVLANRHLGPEVGGRYATCLQWSGLLRGVGMAASGVLGPTVLALYARREIVGIVNYTTKAVRLLGLGLALPVGFICAYADPILRLWVGDGFVEYAPVLVLLVCHLSFNLAFLPVLTIPIATNNVRLPGILQLVFGLLNLGLALVLLSAGYGVYALAASGAIVLTLRNIVFAPIYAALVLGKPWWTFEGEVFPIVIGTVVVALSGRWVSEVFPIVSWPHLLLHGFAISMLYSAVCMVFLASKESRLSLKTRFEVK